MARKPFVQGTGSGLCSSYSIINALSILFPARLTTEAGEKLLGALIDAYPGDARELMKNGAERPEMEAMIIAAALWTVNARWPAWISRPLHPIAGETAHEFWDTVALELKTPRAAAVVGFGSDSRAGTRYEPHYSCIKRVTKYEFYLKDSDCYKRVGRKETGVRPEARWSLEDCWIFNRVE